MSVIPQLEELEFAQAALDAAGPVGVSENYWVEAWSRLVRNRVAMAAGTVVLILAVISVLAPAISTWVTHYLPSTQILADQFVPPGRAHWLGADELGRDTLTRMVWGGRVSLGIGFLTIAIALAVGGTVGLVAGFYGGALDDVLMRIVDMVLAIPAIYLFILMSILLRPNAISLAFIIASVGWGGVARLVRGEVLTLRERDYVMAARAAGARDVRLILRHLLPNALPVMIVAATLGVAGVILTEAALDFLGLGVGPPTASWGNMLSGAHTAFTHSIWVIMFPGLAIFVTVLCLNVFGAGVRDAFDPRLR